ncbi:hypothetical protein [Actinoplanes auranticolor]|uniref:Uncharacterized protein n=1 Tax=Actinoplanes auranticolor TaxID=47988 RepID=A0A919SUA9_9ACTN|nr:hypothetical protein [Actinoplanes auranticolor]GIM79065.1 hypothetical protein Aau02nite_83930 [Actinoplanes auranticolor]
MAYEQRQQQRRAEGYVEPLTMVERVGMWASMVQLEQNLRPAEVTAREELAATLSRELAQLQRVEASITFSWFGFQCFHDHAFHLGVGDCSGSAAVRRTAHRRDR